MSLSGEGVYAENEWELYVFPEKKYEEDGIIVLMDAELSELTSLLENGKDVLLLSPKPFKAIPTSFRIALAGRTTGNLATVVEDHPLLKDMPHEGFCGWQFAEMMEGGDAVCFEAEIPFNPIVEVVSTHKYAIKQAALFEFKALNGRLLVCSFNLNESDSAAMWLKARLTEYMRSDEFNPIDIVDEKGIIALSNSKIVKTAGNTNLAFNANDKTAVRKKK